MCKVGTVGEISDCQPEGPGFNLRPGQGLNLWRPSFATPSVDRDIKRLVYTGGILQRLDTDVHSVVTAKRSTALWQRKRAKRCDSDGADSNVTALTVTALGHQWLWHWCDSDVYISVTAMATDTAVTAVRTDSAVSAVAADTAVTAMFTLVWQ